MIFYLFYLSIWNVPYQEWWKVSLLNNISKNIDNDYANDFSVLSSVKWRNTLYLFTVLTSPLPCISFHPLFLL